MINRRKFIKLSAVAGLASSMPAVVFSESKQKEVKTSGASPLIWANLLHLSTNMWEDHPYIKRNSIWSDIVEEEIHR